MPQTIADTVKALTEFEADLDMVKAEMTEAKKKMIKDAGEWAEAARVSALAEAQKTFSDRLAQARVEAEAEAEGIKKKGEVDTKRFAESISKHKTEATELVLRRLLGEGQ